ncbi:hypothetical protein M758_5G124500 [Ceratodon purpureus]|nr:hypothetical protein M758_5G124500 [Ceratodon purpureus]
MGFSFYSSVMVLGVIPLPWPHWSAKLMLWFCSIFKPVISKLVPLDPCHCCLQIWESIDFLSEYILSTVSV